MTIARRSARLALVAVAAFIPLGATGAPAPEMTAEQTFATLLKSARFTVTVEGTKQGVFKGSAGARGLTAGKIEGVAFHYAVKSPRDAASGMASGKRMHSPVVFTKAVDASSPQLFQALTTNESLKSVVFEFYGSEGKGMETTIYTVRLVNAFVSEWKQYAGDTIDGGRVTSTDGSTLEDVSLNFQKIEIEHKAGKTMAVDDWYTQS